MVGLKRKVNGKSKCKATPSVVAKAKAKCLPEPKAEVNPGRVQIAAFTVAALVAGCEFEYEVEFECPCMCGFETNLSQTHPSYFD